jgi:phosphoserine phosphatase RsbU/P
MPELNFSIEQVELEPGDILFAYTDGVVDARSPEGKPFGEEQLKTLITAPTDSAASLLDRVYENLKVHISEADQFDDITMLAVRRDVEPAI